MATESIGALIQTAIPGYTDSADIQAALRAYHYGSYSYDPANTSPGSLVTPSIAKTIYDIQADITSLENRPSSGGEVDATQPAPGDFTPPEIPDGFIWVDSDGTVGGQPTSATSVFTNSAPTLNLTTGVVWVDKDPTVITNNPFIPISLVNNKGDMIVGTADNSVGLLSVASTNGYILSVNSATTSGLDWIANDQGDITAVTSGTGISVTSSTGPIPSVAVDTAVVATTSNTLTMTGKTLTSPTITTPTLTFSSTTSATTGQVAFNSTTNKIIVGNGTNAIEFAPSTLLFNDQTSTTYTFALTDKDKLVTASTSATQTYSVPTNASVAFPVGSQINIIQIGAGQVTIQAASTGTTTISSTGATSTAPKLRAQFSSATLLKAATDLWYVIGDIS